MSTSWNEPVVEQVLDALAGGQLALGALCLDRPLGPGLAGLGLAPLELGETCGAQVPGGVRHGAKATGPGRSPSPPGSGLDVAAALERPAERLLVGVFEVGADRQPAGDDGSHGTPSGFSTRERYMAVASPSRLGLVQTMTSAMSIAFDTLEQLPDVELLGPHPVDRAQRAAEHVVAAAERVGLLDGDHVAGVLDDAEDGRVPPLVGTDRAELVEADVETDRADDGPLLHLDDRLGEPERASSSGIRSR